MILLDTNVVSAVMQNKPDPAVVAWLDLQPADQIWLPSVVVFELRCGLGILPEGARRRWLEQGLEQLLVDLVQGRIAPLDRWLRNMRPSSLPDVRQWANRWICATP